MKLYLDHRPWLTSQELRQLVDPLAMQMRAIDRNKNVSELQLCSIDSARNLYASHNDIDPASALQNNI